MNLYFAALAAQAILLTASAATPVLTELRPRGAMLGRPFTLTLMGRNLGEGARVTSTMPASFGESHACTCPRHMLKAKNRLEVFPIAFPLWLRRHGW